MLRPEPTCLVIADISGYTVYLSGVELDHAHDILADLMNTVVVALKPSFRLAKLEGDAAFAYTVAETIDASILQDTIEGTYFAFRRRLRDIGQASRCECNACIRMPTLDLKFVVHHGSVIRQRIAGRDELVGPNVILVHRLLKNRVVEETGLTAYALYTGACIEAMGADPEKQGLRAHVEETDVAGSQTVWLRDLHAAWDQELARKRFEITREQAFRVYECDIAAPQSLVWEYVTSPIRRPQWGGDMTIEEVVGSGRRSAGTVNHCIHGADTIVEEILDWSPVDYWTTRATMPQPGLPRIVMTDALSPIPGGTHVEVRIGQPRPRERPAFQMLMSQMDGMFQGMQAGLKAAAEAEAAARAAAAAEVPEPPMSIPAASGRR